MTRWGSIFSTLAVLAIVGSASCNDSSVSGSGSGGTPSQGGGSGGDEQPGTGGNGSGGSIASGGSMGSGGATGAGGRVGTGGASGVGGATAAGGRIGRGGSSTSGNGGQTETGGATANGGRTGRGGQSGTGGAVGGAMTGGQPGTGGTAAGGSTGTAAGSPGCGKTPTLKKSGSSNFTPNTISVSGTNREYVIRWPDSYDNKTPYRLHLTLHGYGGTYAETAGNYFGLWSLSNNTTIFIALSAINKDWRTGDNLAYVDAVLKAVEDDLCIDTSHVTLEGFSQGAAMSWTLACSRPGVFIAAVGHSGGGVTNPTKCDPVAYFGSGGLQESVTQTTQTDQFAKWDGCTVETFAKAPTGGHACYDYKGCSAGHPVRWCNYDGPHTPSPTDSGKSTSWMPQEVWTFLGQF